MSDIKLELRRILRGSSSQSPVDFATLAKGHQRRRVEIALMQMYQEREIGCCKITKGREETTVWWMAGIIEQDSYYGKVNQGKHDCAPKRSTRVVRRISPMSSDVLAAITATPGLSMPELILTLAKPRAEEPKIRNSISSPLQSKKIKTEGVQRHYRFFPGATA